MESMATGQEERCPICLESWEEASYVVPCLHQFCYPCILRWVDSKPECPLCRRRVSSILHSVRGDGDLEEHVVAPPVAAQLPATRPTPVGPIGGFYAYTWAFIFRIYPSVLHGLLPWLRHELAWLFEDAQAAEAAQSLVLSSLRYFGLDQDALGRLLQDTLGTHTSTFVQQLVETIVRQCGGEARRQLGLEDTSAAEEQEGGPTAAPSPAASRGASSAPSLDLRGRPGSPPATPVPTHGEPEEMSQEPEEAVAGPAAPSGGSQQRPGRPRRAPKRRAGNPEEPAQPHKKPPRRR